MIRKIEIGEKNKDTLELVFGSGDIMFHGLFFADQRQKYSLGFCEMPARPIGAETSEFMNLNTDELPAEVKCIFSFEKPEAVTAVIHSLIELQKRMFDKEQEKITT